MCVCICVYSFLHAYQPFKLYVLVWLIILDRNCVYVLVQFCRVILPAVSKNKRRITRFPNLESVTKCGKLNGEVSLFLFLRQFVTKHYFSISNSSERQLSKRFILKPNSGIRVA